MKKRHLTKKQSGNLIKLGIDPNNASFVFWKQIKNWKGEPIEKHDIIERFAHKPMEHLHVGFEKFEHEDIFSLEDLMSILPNRIEDNDLLIRYSDFGWNVGYFDIQGSTHIKLELIDAVYDTLVWYIKNMDVNKK